MPETGYLPMYPFIFRSAAVVFTSFTSNNNGYMGTFWIQLAAHSRVHRWPTYVFVPDFGGPVSSTNTKKEHISLRQKNGKYFFRFYSWLGWQIVIDLSIGQWYKHIQMQHGQRVRKLAATAIIGG